MYHTLLFFHVLGAFALVAGTSAAAPFALEWGKAALDSPAAARLARIGAALSGAGAVMVVVFGLWLVDHVGYHFFRFWILAALALVGVGGYCNGQVAAAARRALSGEAERRRLNLLWIGDMLSAALILVLMIWKPGYA